MPSRTRQDLFVTIAVLALFLGMLAWSQSIPDVRYSDDRHWISGNMVVSEWLLTGTRRDGVPVNVRGCDHYEFRDGKVVRKDSYWKIVEKP